MIRVTNSERARSDPIAAVTIDKAMIDDATPRDDRAEHQPSRDGSPGTATARN